MAKIKYDVDPDMVSWLEGDPEHCDPKIAAWTLVAASGSIGAIRSRGLWHVVDGHLRKTVSDDTGVSRSVPSCFGRGQGIYAQSCDITTVIGSISERLQRVQILCGDWKRILTPTVAGWKYSRTKTFGVFLDPPYRGFVDGFYRDTDNGAISDRVEDWCREAPDDARVVLCGYEGEHDSLLSLGWMKIIGYGYGGRTVDKCVRERLWLSPACELPEQARIIGAE